MTEIPEKQVVIIGAGRQGRNALEILQIRHAVAGFLDDTRPAGDRVDGAPVLGAFNLMRDAETMRRYAWFVAIGDNAIRQNLTGQIIDKGGVMAMAIHPTASIAATARIEPGAYVGALCRLHSGATLDMGVLMEAGSFGGCDTRMGAFSRTGPNCVLTGGASVGALSFLGAGTVVGENIAVGANCIVGANSVVLRSTGDEQRLYGAPARPRTLASS